MAVTTTTFTTTMTRSARRRDWHVTREIPLKTSCVRVYRRHALSVGGTRGHFLQLYESESESDHLHSHCHTPPPESTNHRGGVDTGTHSQRRGQRHGQ